MRTDLHIHTIASDGCWTPERVCVEVQARNIGLFAVADHDSVASLSSAKALAQEAGLAFLNAVEISSLLGQEIFHILAYGFDPNHPAMALLLRENQTKLNQFNEDILHHLVAAEYEIDLDNYASYQYDPTRGGWKVLNFLIDCGLCTDVNDYFRNLIAKLPVIWPLFPHPAQAIAAIREAGGVPIMAHPGASMRREGISEEKLNRFLDFGIAGLECYSNYHDEAMTRFFLDWCARYDLLITGGSDCHGGFVGRELGIPIVDTADLRLGKLTEHIIGVGTRSPHPTIELVSTGQA
ncbi:MAG: PHP domain-containing protein [Chloroflexi bacterium]|nr:PHP domain-containing protein [Chloroflexota bacterium]